MSKTIAFFIVIVFVIANGFWQSQIYSAKAEHYKTQKFDVAIFPANYIDLIASPENSFTPTKTEIDRAELYLRSHLKEANNDLINQSSTPIIHRKLKKYKRQYFGYIDKNGDRILLINCFWSKNKSDSEIWLRNRIIVNDGGSYYWNIKFNLDKNALFELVVNGYS